MSEPKRRRRPPTEPVKEKWEPPEVVWDRTPESRERGFCGSLWHYAISGGVASALVKNLPIAESVLRYIKQLFPGYTYSTDIQDMALSLGRISGIMVLLLSIGIYFAIYLLCPRKNQKTEHTKEKCKDCETEFYGSFLHVALSCIIAFLGSSTFMTYAHPNWADPSPLMTQISNIGIYYASFLLFLYLAYSLLAGLSCLFSKK